MSSSFTEVFGDNNIAPAGPTYLSLVPMAADVTLEWPVEEAITGLVVANIIDVQASGPGLAIHLPSAELASTGYVALFNNIGGNNVNVEDSTGGVIVSLAPGTVWQIYLIDNSTPAGSWRIFQFGASVSTAVAAALAGSGLTAKGTQLATSWVLAPQNADYIIVDADRAKVEQYTGGVGTFTLPQPATVGSGWYVGIKNSGSGNLTLNPPDGVVTIDGAHLQTFAPGESGLVVTDGANFFVLFHGGGGSGTGFSYVIINAAGSGNLVLSGAQLNQIGYRFTGVLTGNRAIVVPNTAQEYWVDNETTGAFTFTVGTAAQITGGGGVIVPQGNQKICQCDGTNVIPGDSTSVSFPISVANGGTGATNAATARTNLGATAVGAAVFTAASVAAAQATLSVPPNSRLVSTGAGLTGGGDLSADRTIAIDPINSTGLYIVKPADTARASVTALAVDPDLQFVAAANTVYEVEVNLYAGSPAGGTGDMAASISFSGTLASILASWAMIGASAGAGAYSTNTAFIGAAAIGGFRARGGENSTQKFIISVANAGTIAVNWAQSISDPLATVLFKGSFMRVRKLA